MTLLREVVFYDSLSPCYTCSLLIDSPNCLPFPYSYSPQTVPLATNPIVPHQLTFSLGIFYRFVGFIPLYPLAYICKDLH